MKPTADTLMIASAMFFWPYLILLNVGMAMVSPVPTGPGVRAIYS